MKGIYITASAFDLMRWRLEGFYRTAEQVYEKEGVSIAIHEVDAIPLDIQGEEIRFLVTATEYQYRK